MDLARDLLRNRWGRLSVTKPDGSTWDTDVPGRRHVSTLRLVDRYSRRYRAKEGIGAGWTRLDCHACGRPIETGSKVILESRPMW